MVDEADQDGGPTESGEAIRLQSTAIFDPSSQTGAQALSVMREAWDWSARLLSPGTGRLDWQISSEQPPPSDSRAANREIDPNSKRFEDPSLLEAVQRLRPIAEWLSLSMSQLALAWVLRDSRVSSAIIGASRPEQIEENVAAVGVELDDTTLREIDEAIEGVARR